MSIINRASAQAQIFTLEACLGFYFFSTFSARVCWVAFLADFDSRGEGIVDAINILYAGNLQYNGQLWPHNSVARHRKTGVGKSGLAVGILCQALISGSRGRFYDVQRLLDDLYAPLADRSTTKLLDELGYLTLNKEQMNAFFKLMKERYEAGKSTIITTSLEPDEWYHLLKPKDMVDALLDRLSHRCVVVKIEGQSLRAGLPE